MREIEKQNLIEFIQNKFDYELTKQDLQDYKQNNLEEWRKFSAIATLQKKYRGEQNFYAIARKICLNMFILIDNKAKNKK